MTFRRSSRRFSRRRFRRFGRPVARLRRTWVTSLVPTVCQPLEVALQPCGELSNSSAQARFILLNNTLLEDKFSDRARVARIVGDLLFAPTWDDTVDPTCVGNFVGAISAYGQAFMALRRYDKNAAGFALSLDPLGSDVDYSEGQWLKTWQHFWTPQVSVEITPTQTVKNCTAVVCTDTHTTGAPDNIFTEGTGTISIETDCLTPNVIECEAEQDPICRQLARFPQPWRQHFDIKKRIPVRENQEVAFEIEFMWPNASLLVNPRIQVMGGVKLLLEY